MQVIKQATSVATTDSREKFDRVIAGGYPLPFAVHVPVVAYKNLIPVLNLNWDI